MSVLLVSWDVCGKSSLTVGGTSGCWSMQLIVGGMDFGPPCAHVSLGLWKVRLRVFFFFFVAVSESETQ